MARNNDVFSHNFGVSDDSFATLLILAKLDAKVYRLLRDNFQW